MNALEPLIARLKQLLTTLPDPRTVGHEKLRAALATLALSFFATIYFLVGLNAPPGWGPAFAALSVVYLVAFLAVAAEWFWGRWFASGLGWSGAMVGVIGLISVGWHPSLMIYALLHAVVLGALAGGQMAARFEQQSAWREQYGVDDYGVAKLGKTVTRGAASLPTLIVWALAPKEPQGLTLVAAGSAALAIAGLVGAVRGRTWSLFALAGGAALAAFTMVAGHLASACGGARIWASPWSVVATGPASWLGVALATAAVVPFVPAAARYLRR